MNHHILAELKANYQLMVATLQGKIFAAKNFAAREFSQLLGDTRQACSISKTSLNCAHNLQICCGPLAPHCYKACAQPSRPRVCVLVDCHAGSRSGQNSAKGQHKFQKRGGICRLGAQEAYWAGGIRAIAGKPAVQPAR